MVRSGLDDTMREAYQEIKETFNEHNDIVDFRTAALVVAMQKIANTHKRIGL